MNTCNNPLEANNSIGAYFGSFFVLGVMGMIALIASPFVITYLIALKIFPHEWLTTKHHREHHCDLGYNHGTQQYVKSCWGNIIG
jgi:hypothetical protein